MTKRDLLTLALKLWALYLLLGFLFSSLPSQILYYASNTELYSFSLLLLMIVLLMFLFIMLMYKADFVIRITGMDRGFEEERIDLGQLNSELIIKLGVFIIWGVIFIQNLPYFLFDSILTFKASLNYAVISEARQFDWLLEGLQVALGYLMLTNYARIAKLFRAKT